MSAVPTHPRSGADARGLVSGLRLISLVLLAGVASGADPEQGLAQRIIASLRVGEAVWLETGGRKFLGLYTLGGPGKPKGAALILHDLGRHPDWPEVVATLRKKLPEGGWTTLAIQLPVLPPGTPRRDYGATLEEAQQRITAAIGFLRSKGIAATVLIGHGLGATAALLFAGTTAKSRVAGFIGIGIAAGEDLDPPLNLVGILQKAKLPILDLYGSQDTEPVLMAADRRRQAARAGEDPLYRQVKIEGADHEFTAMQAVLIQRVRGWMEKRLLGPQPLRLMRQHKIS